MSGNMPTEATKEGTNNIAQKTIAVLIITTPIKSLHYSRTIIIRNDAGLRLLFISIPPPIACLHDELYDIKS
jgi:hypothetical protein